MKTKTINLYSFDELSEDAKETALTNWGNDLEYFWSDDAIESLKKFAEHFDCELKNYSIDFFNARQSAVYFNVPDYVNERSNKEILALIKSAGTYNKKTLKGLGDCKFTGYCMDEDCMDGLREAWFVNNVRNMKELLMAGFNTWAIAVENDYESQFTAEYFSEHADANGFEFDEDGKRI